MPVNRRGRRVALNRARTGSAIRGSKSFRRLMKGMPGAVRAEMADVLTKSGPSVASIVANRVKGTTKRRTGRLEAGVKWKVFPRTLRLQVGFLGTKTGRAKLFYARILDLGRKAQTVTVNRRKEAGSLLERGRRVSHGSYQLKVKAIRAKRFVTGGMGDLRGTITTRLRGVWDRSLRRVAAGDE